MRKYKSVAALVALFAVPAICSAALIEGFESGTNGWSSGQTTLGVSTTDFTEGSQASVQTFNVAAGMAGWGEHSVLYKDALGLISASDTTLSIDVKSEWANEQGWGVYGNEMRFMMNSEGGWVMLSPMISTAIGGGWMSHTYDISAHATAFAASEWQQMGVFWFLGTWADNGVDNGTHTIHIDNIQTIPEPTTIGLVGLFGGCLVFARRRFKV